MADFLLDNPRARRLVATLGLPVPLPERLERADGPWEDRPLHDRTVVVGGAGALGTELANALAAAGADPWVFGGDLQPWVAAGEAWGRPPRRADDGVAADRPWALVFDATAFAGPGDLRGLYDFFHPRIKGIARSGRVLVLGRPDGGDPAAAAAMRALEGFVRSVSREVGRRGATANLVLVDEGAEDRLEPVLRFLLSVRSAYVTAQPIVVSKRVRGVEARLVRPLEGKVALVTGAARGIGEAIALTMAREGAKVIVLDRPEDDALGADVARRAGGEFLGVDLSAPDAAERVAGFVEARFGRLDVLVNNAGITRDKTLANMKPEVWDLTIEVNLASVIRLTQALEPLLARDARVVCLSSIAGIAGNIGQTNYAASKAGVIGFVEAYAAKVARKGIAVNAIAPGFIETRLTAAIPVATREAARRMSHLGQGGLPADIAEVATFLSSPGACALSGRVVRVCGGSFVGA